VGDHFETSGRQTVRDLFGEVLPTKQVPGKPERRGGRRQRWWRPGLVWDRWCMEHLPGKHRQVELTPT